jgi:uncharacterized membrane protein
MSIRLPLIVSVVLIAAMIALNAWTWTALPPMAPVAIHWDIHGRPNWYVPKEIGLILMPAMGLVLTALFALWPRIEPRRANLATGRLAYEAGWLGTMGILTMTHIVIVMQARGAGLDVVGVVLAAVAVFQVVLGNFLGKSRSNFFVGVRTPWSLSSDLAWERTNRMVGRLFVLTGFATLAALFAAGAHIAIFLLIGCTFGSVLIGVCLSYFYWRRDPERHAGDGSPQ